ncbi:MAG: nucleobase:cation symporter-2 family protein [Verrucomicrobiota bacterium]
MAETETHTSDRRNKRVLYGLNDRMPWKQAIFVGLQHLLAMLVGCVTAPLIVAQALDFSPEEQAFLVSISLFTSGLGTLLQVKTVGVVGSGLLTVTGTSFAFISPLIIAGQKGGIPLMLGMSIISAPTQIALAPFLPRLKKYFSPLVSGVVVILIGLSLIPTSMFNISLGLPNMAEDQGWIALPMAIFVVAVVLLMNALDKPWARMGAILAGLIAGYLACLILGAVSPPPIETGNWINFPTPLKYGLAFDIQLLIPFIFIFIATTMESIGDLTASSDVSGEPTKGEIYWKRIRGGVLCDGINSMIAGTFGAFPNTTFSQNNGVIQLTGVASRQCGYVAAIALIIMGLIPPVGAIFAAMPKPVMGGLTLILFGLIFAAGVRILHSIQMEHREIVILAFSVAMGVGVQTQPDVLNTLPETLKTLFSSSVSTGGITALILNILMPHPKALPEVAESSATE